MKFCMVEGPKLLKSRNSGCRGGVSFVDQGVVRHIFFSQFISRRHVDEALESLQSIRDLSSTSFA